jgi:hypothetical protein
MREEAVKGLFDMLRDGSDIAEDGDEIMIVVPAGNQVEMEVIGYPGPGGGADITADIEAMRKKAGIEYFCRLPDHTHQRRCFLGAEVNQTRNMPQRGYEEVPVAIREAIEKDNVFFVFKENELFFVVRKIALRFEEAGRRWRFLS